MWSTAYVILLSPLVIQVTHGKQKIASIQGFVSQEREKYEKMVSAYHNIIVMTLHC